MYPTISYFIKDIFGVYIPLPFPTFGFLVAMAFFAAAYFFAKELKRKEKEGLLSPSFKTIVIGKPYPFSEYFSSALMGFIIAWKLFYALSDYTSFSADPQQFLLSTKGSIMGGIIGAAVMLLIKFWEDKKQRLPEPETKETEFHPYQHVSNMTMLAAIGGVLGAKLFHNLEEWNDFINNPIEALLSFSGLSIYGGLIIGGASVIYYAWKNKLKPLHVMDACAPALMMAYAIGRIGCHLSGDGDWGIVNTLPTPTFIPNWLWAYTYPNNVVSEGIPIEGCTGLYCNVLPQPVFPTPLYESIISLIFFAVLWQYRKKIIIPGVMFCVYMVMNGVERFFIEKIRINPPYNIFGIQATQAELISFLLIIVGTAFIGLLYYKNKNAQLK